MSIQHWRMLPAAMDELSKEMRVEIFTFCDSASQKAGSLSISGTFDSREAKAFPTVYQEFCLAIRVRLPRTYPVAMCRLLFLSPEGQLMVKPTELKVTGPVWNAVITNRNVKFSKPGLYRVVLYAEDHAVASLPLMIKRAPKPGEVLEGYLN